MKDIIQAIQDRLMVYLNETYFPSLVNVLIGFLILMVGLHVIFAYCFVFYVGIKEIIGF